MFDGVFNHCSSKFSKWQDVKKNGFDSKYIKWFIVNEWPFENENNSLKGKFHTYAFLDSMPKLNTSEQEVIDYIIDICEFWIKEYNIDAIRIDASDEISHECLKQIRKKVKSLKKDFFILGENWHDSMQWLRGAELDSTTNYPLRKSIIDFWTNPNIDRNDFYIFINSHYIMYMKQTNEVLFNMVDSHDTPRLITCVKDIDKFYQILAFLLTITGSPCIYYGTEALLEGGNATDSRRCMPWESIENGEFKDTLNTIKKLIKLRKKYVSLRKGECYFLNYSDNNRIIAYKKIFEKTNEEVEVILNCSNESIKIDLNSKKLLFSRLYNKNILKGGGIIIRR